MSNGTYFPYSPRKIWQILKDAGRIAIWITFHHLVERPEPLSHCETDFRQLGDVFEFLTAVDRGTSILVDTPSDHSDFPADGAATEAAL